MNDKLAKALRRIARGAGLPAENQYLIHNRTGVIRLGRCTRGLMQNLKRRVIKGELKGLNRGVHAPRAGS